jgi:hypothetical protein
MPFIGTVEGTYGYGRGSTPTAVTNNLVLYYDPSNPSSYPGSGTTVNDLSPNPVDGTLSNVTFSTPYFNYNGSNAQVTIPDNTKLEPGSGDWTMEAWFYTTAFKTESAGVILGKFDPGGLAIDVSYSIRTNNTGILYAQFGDGTGSFINSTTYQTSLSVWAQVVYVWTNVASNNLQTYINGASIGNVSHTFSSLLNTSANLYLGSYNGGEFAQWFNGRIGITRLYNTALTSAQVLQNYNADRLKYGL